MKSRLGKNNPEIHTFRLNRFHTYMVLIFSNSNKAQIYKMVYRNSTHHEIETFMNPTYLNLVKPNEDTEDFHNRGLNDKKFLFEIED